MLELLTNYTTFIVFSVQKLIIYFEGLRRSLPIRHGCNYNPHQSDKICLLWFDIGWIIYSLFNVILIRLLQFLGTDDPGAGTHRELVDLGRERPPGLTLTRVDLVRERPSFPGNDLARKRPPGSTLPGNDLPSRRTTLPGNCSRERFSRRYFPGEVFPVPTAPSLFPGIAVTHFDHVCLYISLSLPLSGDYPNCLQ